MLRAGGGIEQKFAGRRYGRVGRVEHHAPDLVADWGAARLAGEHMLDPGVVQMIGEHLDLGRLARTLDAFERYESAQVKWLPRKL